MSVTILNKLPTVIVEFRLVDERFPAQNTSECILISFFLPGSLIIKWKLRLFRIGGMRDPPVRERPDESVKADAQVFGVGMYLCPTLATPDSIL